MKNQAELVTKRPPARLKTDMHVAGKKEALPTSVQAKPRLPLNNNDLSLKKKSPYSPRNLYTNRGYANDQTVKNSQVRKQSNSRPDNSISQDKVDFTLLKNKYPSEYLIQSKYSPEDSSRLQIQQLKSNTHEYQFQIQQLKSKIARLECQVKQKQNSQGNMDPKSQQYNRLVQLSTLRQQLAAANYRQKSLVEQKNVLLASRLINQRKIGELECQRVKDQENLDKLRSASQAIRKQKAEHQRSLNKSMEELKMQEWKTLDKYTEIVKYKDREISRLKDEVSELESSGHVFKDRLNHLESELYKAKTNLSDKAISSLAEFEKERYKLSTQIKRLNHQLFKGSRDSGRDQMVSAKYQLQKQLATTHKEIQSLLQKNQQLQKQSTEQIRYIGELQNKCSKLQRHKCDQSKRTTTVMSKSSRLQQQLTQSKSVSPLGKSVQLGKARGDDHKHQNATNNLTQKLHAATKTLESSVSRCHQLQKRLKVSEGLLAEANTTVTKMRMQLLNKLYSQTVDLQ